jgi:hypothetical protein
MGVIPLLIGWLIWGQVTKVYQQPGQRSKAKWEDELNYFFDKLAPVGFDWSTY